MPRRKRSETQVYHSIRQPEVLRQTLLRGAIDCTHLLSKYDQLLILRSEKKKKLKALQVVRSSLEVSVKKLAEQRSLDPLPLSFRSKFVSSPQKEVSLSKPVQKKESSEVDRLRRELAEIEGRLGSL